MDYGPPSDQRRARGSRALTLVEALTLLGVLALSLAGFESWLDLQPADEIGYHRTGRQVFDGAFHPIVYAFAPVWTAVYGAADWLLAGRVAILQDVMFPACAVAATLALWFALRPILGPTPALLTAAWFATSALCLAGANSPPNNVHLFTGAVEFCAIGAFVRGRHALGLLGLGLAALNRVELVPWLLVAASVVLWRARGSGTRNTRVTAAACLALGFAHLIGYGTVAAARDRSWLVFRQHFSAGWSERHDPAGNGDAMIYNASIITDTFPGATSWTGAARANPAAFAEHVIHNASALPRHLFEAFARPAVHWPALSFALVAMLGALAIAGLWSARRTPRASLRHGRCDIETRAVLWASLVCIPLSVIVRPRPELLFPCVPLIAIAVARSAAAGVRALTRNRPSFTSRAGVVTALLALAVVLPRAYPPDRARPRPFREVVELLREHPPAPQARVFGTFGPTLVFIANVPGKGIELDGSSPGEVRPGDLLILTTNDLEKHGHRLADWYAALCGGGWTLRAAGFGAWTFARTEGGK